LDFTQFSEKNLKNVRVVARIQQRRAPEGRKGIFARNAERLPKGVATPTRKRKGKEKE